VLTATHHIILMGVRVLKFVTYQSQLKNVVSLLFLLELLIRRKSSVL